MVKSISRRIIDVPEAILYGGGTVIAGVTTIVLATGTVGLAMTGVGIPLALVTAFMTLGTASATTYCGSKTIHKSRVACGSSKHCHSGRHALTVLTYGEIH